ncbi:hypothetical protein FH972_024194 [Carpinus fangiana]|uniref:Nucleoside phosphorylase domain-containing protein n=1 Tax=Carpinus fangiana TaxID=176857 RepID=A0A5N6KXM7_9ROSI|nr:hypothetical protein FH972_024194 [Carpinus fangiana]
MSQSQKGKLPATNASCIDVDQAEGLTMADLSINTAQQRSLPARSYDDITIAWICALPHELAASIAALDEDHGCITPSALDDPNKYVLGKVSGHNIVMLCLPLGRYGTISAANVATHLKRSFPSVRFALLVGIGAGIPSAEHDIRLGDVVVSKPTGTAGGVIQYDLGKIMPDGSFEVRGFLSKPPMIFLNAAQVLQARHETQKPAMISHLDKLTCKLRANYSRPKDSVTDPIVGGKPDLNPKIHYGLIASGNKVISHAEERNRLRKNHDVICLEMEAAGIMDYIPCLVIRGVCDFADSTKNDDWQRYAAATAAAYAKEFLEHVGIVSTSARAIPAAMVSLLPRDPGFVGRENALETIKKALDPRGSNLRKSQIAIEYAHRHRQASPQTSIFWVSGSTPDRFLSSYVAIAEEMKLPGIANPQCNRLDLVHRWLLSDSSGQWLMILDNVDDVDFVRPPRNSGGKTYDFTMSRYLPTRGLLLVTSRSREAISHIVEPDHFAVIDVMTKVEACVLLNNRIPNDLGNEQERAALATNLDFIPLALTQASSYIRWRRRATVGKYLNLLNDKKSRLQVLKSEGGDLRRDPEFPNAVLATWQISMEQIRQQHEAASDLLSLMSIFDRQNIPEFLLSNGKDQDEFEEAIETLIGFSFISEVTTSGYQAFQMHRLVQIATTDWLSCHGKYEMKHNIALQLMLKVYPSDMESFKNQKNCRILEPHAAAILLQDVTDEAASYHVKLNNARCAYNMRIGKYDIAEMMASESSKICVRNLGGSYELALISINLGAAILLGQSRWKEAEGLLEKLVPVYEVLLEPRTRALCHARFMLAKCYEGQGRLNEAEALLARELENEEAAGKSKSFTSQQARLSLGSIFLDRKEYVEAEGMYNKALANMIEKHITTDPVDILICFSQIVRIQTIRKRSADAEAISARVLTIVQECLGEDNCRTIELMLFVSTLYAQHGNLQAAERLASQALATMKNMLGEDDPQFGPIMAHLGMIYSAQERLEEADEMLTQAVPLLRNAFGESSRTRKSLVSLAQVRRTQGRLTEAERLEEEAAGI